VAESTSGVVLASGSPRRRELLTSIGVDFRVVVPNIDESRREGESPVSYVWRLAGEKARAVPSTDELIIAADTTVDLDGEVLGKPVDADDAVSMLRRLSGSTHRVHTGVAVRVGDRVSVDVASAAVTFASLDEALIDWYVSTGEPFDKAGGYALQGSGAVLVDRVDGNVSCIIGLPLGLTVRLAAALGRSLLAPPPNIA
jgi:septum formation protein